jgi:hypothetical protein
MSSFSLKIDEFVWDMKWNDENAWIVVLLDS